IVVYNNSSLNFVELELKADGFVPFATGLENPDYAQIAEAMGMWGKNVERSNELPDAVDEIIAHDEPALLYVVTERQELSITPSISAGIVIGLLMYALRTVFSGQDSELVEVARMNL